MIPESFVDLVKRLPDPRTIDPKDAQDTLVAIIAEAKAVGEPEDHVDRTFTCSVCGIVIGKRPVFQNERAVCDIHKKEMQEVGPPLGRVALAEKPAAKT